MTLTRILVESLADADLTNAQMSNAREIVSRLDPQRFHVTMFLRGEPDARIAGRKNTRLIQLPERRQTARILPEFLLGSHQILFYMKASPASRWYLNLRKKWRDRRVTIGTIESQSNVRSQCAVPEECVRLWEQTILRCDYLFSNSANVRHGLEQEYGLQSEVIPTGVDTKFFSPDWERPRNTRIRVLFVGSLRTYKQPQLLLSAAAKFPEADFRIVGDGPLRSQLISHIAHSGFKNVCLLGALKAEELRQEYRRADIFLFPSSWEGSPKVILEAAACGLPVIARNDYSPETVLHERSGFLAASDEEIFRSLQVLFQNVGLRLHLGHAGRLHSQKFDWDLITMQWDRTFTDIASHRSLRCAS